jgi:hypothetical protein
LTQCAWAAASKKDRYLKGKFWRLAAEGKKRAIVAVAHTLLLLVYQVLGQGKPYLERQTPVVEERQRKRLIRHHVRSLGRLGINVRFQLSARRVKDALLPLTPCTGAPLTNSPCGEQLFSEQPSNTKHSIGRPIVNEKGDLVEFVGTAIDVTEQAQARIELEKAFEEIKQQTETTRRSERELRDVVNTVPATGGLNGSSSLENFTKRIDFRTNFLAAVTLSTSMKYVKVENNHRGAFRICA